MKDRKRQLLAIMFTDISGFTLMMGKDESKTLELLNSNRILQKPLIERHNGKWLKEIGDGVLASFDSVYHAVQCAIEIQHKAPEVLKNKIRIGIHLGDITIEGDDVFGDGVNIASRLETIAEPGGIYVSEEVYNTTYASGEINTHYIGQLRLKNVEREIKVYAIVGDGLAIPSSTRIKQLSKAESKFKISPLSSFLILILLALLIGAGWYAWRGFFPEGRKDIHSVAILPFSNHTGNDSQGFLVDGMHEALIGEMGKVSAIRVVSRTSMLSFANTQKSIHEIAEELNVDAIIEGSVLPANNNTIKIQLNLISALHEEFQLWTKSYELEKENVLDLYSSVVKTIADELNIVLLPEESQRLRQSRVVNPEAYENYLRGRVNLAFLRPDEVKSAEEHFLKAIEIDPEFAPAYAGLAGVWVVRKQLFNADAKIVDPKISEYINQSFRLDSADAETWRWYAAKLGYEYDWTGAIYSLERCLELNPNFAEAHAFYAHYMMFQSQWKKAWHHIDLAVQLDPLNPLIKFFRQVMLMHSGKIDELRKVNGPVPFPIYAYEQKYDSAIASLKVQMLSYGLGEMNNFVDSIYSSTDFKTTLNLTADSLGALSKSRPVQLMLILLLYINAENVQQALYWLEQMYIRKDPNLPYFGIKGPLNKSWIQKEPRFIEIMERINLR